jgi:hypothetical protein
LPHLDEGVLGEMPEAQTGIELTAAVVGVVRNAS